MFAVRIFSLAAGAIVGCPTVVSKLRRPFLSGRDFFITAPLPARRVSLTEPHWVVPAHARRENF